MPPKYSRELTRFQKIAAITWSKKGRFWIASYSIFLLILIILLYLASGNREACDSWAILKWIVDGAAKLRAKLYFSPIPYMLETLLLPLLATALFTVVLRHLALPKPVLALLDTLGGSCQEVVRLSLSRLWHVADRVNRWARTVRDGAELDAIEAIEVSRSLVEITPSARLLTTCLQTPKEIFDSEYRETLRIMADVVRREKKTMIRIVVCPKSDLEDQSQAAKWFLSMHDGNSVKLLRIDYADFERIAGACKIETDRMDVLMFDERVVYALQTESKDDRISVVKINGRYRIFLMDDTVDLGEYQEFFDELQNSADKIVPSATEDGVGGE